MEQWKAALNDRKAGMKYREIADKYSVSVNTVKSWNKRYWGEGKEEKVAAKKSAELQPSENLQPKRRGAPKGNKNNLRHGLYERIYWDTLDEDEKKMVEGMQLNEEENLLIEQIKLLTVREHRLLKRIQEQRNAKGNLALDSVLSRKCESKAGGVTKEALTETTTRTVSAFERIEKLETDLTQIQGRKTRCIIALSKLRLERRKLDAQSSGNAVVNDWIDALLAGGGADE